MSKQALGPNQEKWLAALESGQFKKGIGWLCRDEKYCCLGVACVVAGLRGEYDVECVEFGGCQKDAPYDVVRFLALRGPSGNIEKEVGDLSMVGEHYVKYLTDANDRGASFADIATFCREHPEAVFTEPR